MTDHAETLRRAADAYRRAQKRAEQLSEELADAIRAAYTDEDDPMKKADILRATGHVWSRTWVDQALKDSEPPADPS